MKYDDKFKPGDKVVFSHPDYPPEFVTLKQLDLGFVNSGPVWSVEENDEYWYQEKYIRKLTKLDKALK